jgi:hypothetical protein
MNINPKLLEAQKAIHDFLDFMEGEKQLLPFAGTRGGLTGIVTMSVVLEGIYKLEKKIYAIIAEDQNEKII